MFGLSPMLLCQPDQQCIRSNVSYFPKLFFIDSFIFPIAISKFDIRDPLAAILGPGSFAISTLLVKAFATSRTNEMSKLSSSMLERGMTQTSSAATSL